MTGPVVFLMLCGFAGIAALATVQRDERLGAFLMGASLAWFASVWLVLAIDKIAT